MKSNLEKNESKLITILSHRYEIKSDELKKIGSGYQNLIYEFFKNKKYYMLRISNSETRKLDDVQAELDYITHVSSCGLTVSLPVASPNGKWIETIELKDARYYVVVFNKAKGRHINYPSYLGNTRLYYDLGVVTGRLHKASKKMNNDQVIRNDWQDNYYLKNRQKYISESNIIESLNKIIESIKTIKIERDNYGMIHGDVNIGNYFVDQETITLFDFDECQYSWFVEDIAIQLFYTVYVYNDDSIKERHIKAIEFMKNFLNGYRTENTISIKMIKEIPKFLMLREIIVHVGIYKKWNLNNLKGWRKDYFRDSSRRIETEQPIVDYNEKWL